MRDEALFEAIGKEQDRQNHNIELIASENFVSKEIREAAGSVLTNKYAEGYPGHRYYGGCEYIDVVENLARDRACELFHAEHANVQPHSGSQANMAAYFSLIQPGDRIMGMDLASGGHLTHGAKVSFSGKLFDSVSYGVDRETEKLDYDAIRKLALEARPKMIVAGASAYAREIDFSEFRKIADACGAYLVVDMAHIAGLVATGYHMSPVPYADIVTSTTHKTLRGPRGGIILMGKDFDNPWGKTTPKGEIKKMSALLDSAVFPGTQGGPLEHVIAAKAVAFGEALTEEFKIYQKQVKRNAAVMAQAFMDRGYKVISGGTDNHSMLIDLRTKFPELTGKVAEQALVSADITTNKNMVPFDSRSAFQTSGLRFGTPAITTRGLKEDRMEWIVELIDRVLQSPADEAVIKMVREEVNREMKQHPLFVC